MTKKRKRSLSKTKSLSITSSVASDLGVLSEQQVIARGLTELGKATDALVKRVERAAQDRDPAEAVLDLSKAYHSEERDGLAHSIQCDKCQLLSPGRISFQKASEFAKQIGWEVSEIHDYCPTCRTTEPGRRPDGSFVLAPQLSVTEMIFVTRIQFLDNEFQRGTMPEALVQNAIASGRRSMLSDLAERFNYDPGALVESVKALRGRRAEIPETFIEEVAFIRDVFSILKKEDRGDE